MKKNILLLAIAAPLFLSSCSDFLDVQPEGSATTDTWFANDQQAIDAVDALYERFHQEDLYGRELFWEQAAACDVVWGRTRGYSTLATLQYTGDESPLRTVYNQLSKVISRSNWVIYQLLDKQKSTTLTDVETRSLGEAYFTRGWAHFLIAYRYGNDKQGVPFVRYEDFENGYDNSVPEQRATVMENFRLINEDFDNAIKYLPKFEDYTVENRGRAHKAAAVAFKAKVDAYWATWETSKWQEVITLVNELENTYGRGLASTFEQNFSSDFSDWWNNEYIFTIPGNGGSQGGGSEFPGVSLENKGWGIYNGWGQNKPSYDIYEEMAKDNVDGVKNHRLEKSLLEYGQEFEFFGETRQFYSSSDVESGFMFYKYLDAFKYENATDKGYVNTNGDWPTTRINFPIIRFAEMLLFRAEAYLMTNQAGLALNDLNRIRTRSGLKALTSATTADLYHERRCELAFEFTDHLYDLKRWYKSGDATLKALATAELNAHPRIRKYENRSDANSSFVIAPYEDYTNKATYDEHLMVFPYPSIEITNSNGKLKQNSGY
jgi:hypothetical protein